MFLAGGLVEGDFGLAEDFGGEGFEWLAPFFDLRLELGFLRGGVGEVDWPAVVGEDAAVLVVGYVDVANVLAPAVTRRRVLARLRQG